MGALAVDAMVDNENETVGDGGAVGKRVRDFWRIRGELYTRGDEVEEKRG